MIPVGPGHEDFAHSAVRSVETAWRYSHGVFSALEIVTVPDPDGVMGRSAARNSGVSEHPSDWYFFLDADDEMLPPAFTLVRPDYPATFGAVCLNGRIARENVHPLTPEKLLQHGARGTLSMGCFVNGDVAKSTPFDESLDAGEDFDFYLRLPGFVKLREPLVSIGYHRPSAGGPRGYEDIDWWSVCDEVCERYRAAHATEA